MAYDIVAAAVKLDFGRIEAGLTEQLQKSVDSVRSTNRDRLACLECPIDVDPALLTAIAVHTPVAERTFWYIPQTDTAYLALGTVCRISLPTDAPISSALEQSASSLHATAADKLTWFGGLAFPGDAAYPWTNWPRGEFRLPEILIGIEAECAFVRIYVPVTVRDTVERLMSAVARLWQAAVTSGLDANPAKGSFVPTRARRTSGQQHWERLVAQTAQSVRSGRFVKVVLARRDDVDFTGYLDLKAALEALSSDYPESLVFAFWRNGEVFLGASPERLVGVQENIVDIDCLAGTTARGQTAAEDAALAEELLNSAKNRREHDVVRSWILERITDIVDDVQASTTPGLRKLANVQHLHTPVVARLKKGCSVLDAVQRLHPSPAVAGVPQQDAIEWIQTYEGMDRGWYAGAVGWCDGKGNGSFHVAIRSALIRPEGIHCFSGAGIMADSNPRAEWDETELKFHPMRQALRLRGDEETV